MLTDTRGRRLIEQRPAGDVWAALYQFPLVEAATIELTNAQLTAHADFPDWLDVQQLTFERRSTVYQHQLSHQRIAVVFHVIGVAGPQVQGESGGPQWASPELLSTLAFPRVITRFLEDHTLTLGF